MNLVYVKQCKCKKKTSNNAHDIMCIVWETIQFKYSKEVSNKIVQVPFGIKSLNTLGPSPLFGNMIIYNSQNTTSSTALLNLTCVK